MIKIRACRLLKYFPGSVHKDLDRGGQIAAGRAVSFAVIVEAGGSAAVEVDSVDAAEAKHQLTHLVDGGAAGGHEDQLAVRRAAGG